MEKRRLKLVLFSCVILALLFSLFFGIITFRSFTKPMIAEGSPAITLALENNLSASELTRTLKSRGLIQSDTSLITYMRLKGISNRLKAGIYEIKSGESVLEFISKVLAGKVLVQSFQIIEGTALPQVIIKLENAPYLKYKESDWLNIKGSYPSAEGLLLADTYNYNAGSEAKFVLRLAHRSLEDYLVKSWESRSADLPYHSSYELLIVASIIEKETALAEERKLISGVVVNRLKKNMPLQMDPTVIYGLGSTFKGKLTHEDLKINSAYNTYMHRGLPPTPIAMVGKQAIDAAAHPTFSNYLYYVAKGDGSHHFSATYEEQKQAILRYQTKRGL